MQHTIDRRNWLRQTTLATLGLGISLKTMANEEGITKNYGIENGLINLGANENPYGISEKAKKAIIDFINLSNRYAFNVAALQPFKKGLADHYKVNQDQILITAGSGEALNLLARHYNKGNLVTANPTFAVLPSTSKKIGTKVIEVPLTNDKVHDLPAMLAAITDDTALVYIVNPANPTATIVTPDALKSFCIEASKKAMVVVDEAYIDFLDAPINESMMGLIDQHPNIIIVKTFSKIHAMAGLRIGFIIGHSNAIKQLEQNNFTNSQFAVSNLSVAAAMASLNDEDHKLMSKQKNEVARNFTQSTFKDLNIHFIPSYTNFIFFSLGNYKTDFAKDMLQQNILLRSGDYADGKWARVSIGTMPEMQQFAKLMKQNWKG